VSHFILSLCRNPSGEGKEKGRRREGEGKEKGRRREGEKEGEKEGPAARAAYFMKCHRYYISYISCEHQVTLVKK